MRFYKRFLMWVLAPVVASLKAEIEREARLHEADIEALRKGVGFTKAWPGTVARLSDGATFHA